MPRRTVVFGAESLSLSSSSTGGFDFGAVLVFFVGRTGEDSDSESEVGVFAFAFPFGGALEVVFIDAAGLRFALEPASGGGVRVLA